MTGKTKVAGEGQTMNSILGNFGVRQDRPPSLWDCDLGFSLRGGWLKFLLGRGSRKPRPMLLIQERGRRHTVAKEEPWKSQPRACGRVNTAGQGEGKRRDWKGSWGS